MPAGNATVPIADGVQMEGPQSIPPPARWRGRCQHANLEFLVSLRTENATSRGPTKHGPSVPVGLLLETSVP